MLCSQQRALVLSVQLAVQLVKGLLVAALVLLGMHMMGIAPWQTRAGSAPAGSGSDVLMPPAAPRGGSRSPAARRIPVVERLGEQDEL